MLLSLGLLLALVMLVRASGDVDSGAYTLVTTDDRAELERGEWKIVRVLHRDPEIEMVIIMKRVVKP
jgi:hypothetical protein